MVAIVVSCAAAIVLSGKCVSNFTEFCHHYITNAQTSDNKLCIQYFKAEQLITIYLFFILDMHVWLNMTAYEMKWNEMSLCINYFASRILENLSKCYNVTNNFPSDKRFCVDPGTWWNEWIRCRSAIIIKAHIIRYKFFGRMHLLCVIHDLFHDLYVNNLGKRLGNMLNKNNTLFNYNFSIQFMCQQENSQTSHLKRCTAWIVTVMIHIVEANRW